MTAGLSPTMAEALRRCRESGGLKYVRGGFWIEATADPRKVQASLAHDRPWSKGSAIGWLRWSGEEVRHE